MNYEKTLVVDVSYMPRSIITAQRAFVIFFKGNAEIISEHPDHFKLVNPELKIAKPSIIKIGSYVNAPLHRVPLTRENIFKRDGYTCVYCGESRRKLLTLDHVIPRAKGGGNTWENLVTACNPCNSDKGDLDLEEWGREQPLAIRPHHLMLMKNVNHIPQEWRKFLFM